MAIQNEPTRIQIPFADSGTKNVIPDTNSTPSASQAASWTDGFPAQCSLPLSAGGIPPARADFNGIFNTMTQSIRFGQEGGIWAWDATVDYAVNRLVLGSDSLLYWSVAQSGPNVGGAQDPTLDAAHTYWDQVSTNDANLVHKTGDEYVDGVKIFNFLGISYSDLVKGTNPDVPSFRGCVICDNTHDPANENRIAVLESLVDTDGTVTLRLSPYQYVLGSTVRALFDVVIKPDGTQYMYGPSTLASRNYGGDIVTRDWIPQDTRIVHTTGNESIAGEKTFSNNLIIEKSGPALALTNTGGAGTHADIYVGSTGIRDNATGALQFGHTYQGGAWYAGALLEFDYNGNFALSACAGAGGTRRSLNGATDGTLKWNGQTVQTTSDERLKTALGAVPDEVLDAWEAVGWGQFQFLDAVERKGSEVARLHLGLVAQRVKAVFEDRGLDACAYGILCHEERDAVDEEWVEIDQEAYTDENGVEHPAVTHVERRHEDAVDLWMVRYTEALAMEACCQRRRADRAEARIVALEKRLAALEAKVG